MRKEKEIIGDYTKADFYDRLILFLTYRDLRDEFMDCELHDNQNRVKENQEMTVRDNLTLSLAHE